MSSPSSGASSEGAASAYVPSERAFLGWRIVAVAFLAQLLSNGVTLSAFSNFLIPVSEEFGVSRGTISLGSAIAIGSMGLVGPFVGRLFDRGHARIVMVVGVALSGLGLFGVAQASSLRVATAAFVLVCIGAALFGTMPSMTLVANWFNRKRGFAIGAAMAGATLVSWLGPATAQYFIDHAEWRAAVRFFAMVLLFPGLPVIAFFTVGRPEDVGQLPDGDPVGPTPSVLPPARPVAELVRDPRLWLISTGFGLIMTSPIVLLTLIVPYGMSLGFTGQETNLFFAAMVPFSLFGKLVLGRMADVAPAKPIIAFVVLFNVTIWGLLYSGPSYPLFILTGVVYGLGIGGAAPVQGVVLARCMGRENFGTASGLGGIVAVLLLVGASLMSSLLQGDGEGYPLIFLIQMGLITFAGILLSFVAIPANEADA